MDLDAIVKRAAAATTEEDVDTFMTVDVPALIAQVRALEVALVREKQMVCGEYHTVSPLVTACERCMGELKAVGLSDERVRGILRPAPQSAP